MSGGEAADEPGPFHCHECDARTWNEPDMHAYCDACRTDHMASARDTAHAAGYAEAVADVRMLLRACDLAAQARLANPNERPVLEYTSKIFGELVGLLDSGAHVGAAKKGGG